MAVGTFRNITVKEKAGGLYQARARVKTRSGEVKQMARTRPTREQAVNDLHAALQDEATRATRSRFSRATLFEAVATRYLEGVERDPDTSTTTVHMYRHHVDRTLVPNLGKLRLEEVTVGVIEDLFDELANRYAPATLRNIRAPLSGILKMAVRLEAIPTNPMTNVSRIKGKSARARALSEKQIELLLKKAEEDKVARAYDLPDFIRFMLNTGCRIGEALALRWENVDLKNSLIDIRHNIVNLGPIEVHDGKTEAARRKLYMTPELFEVLFRRSLDADVSGPEHPVFASSNGTYRSPANVRRALRRLYALVPELEWVTQPTHVFRKTVATRMGADPAVSDQDVADFLGHEDISTTQKSYIDRSRPSRGAAAALQGITPATGA